MTIAPGTTLGRYEIQSPLGAGGMGEVYLARDIRLGREVAVKVLPASVSADAERLRRFEQEACAASKLNHPHILVIHDVGTHDGIAFMVSELLLGETLRERISAGALPLPEALAYAVQIATGLAAAHEHGIVHRDLKPENIFVTPAGQIKILDFGLAKLTHAAAEADTNAATQLLMTQPGMILGTVGYMSPEQVDGRPADARADIFSLGVVLYEMLAGRRAFEGESVVDTLNAIRKEQPLELTQVNARVPAGLARVVRRCLEKKPERRFQSASDLAFALEALAETPPSTPGLDAAPPLGRKLRREHVAWLLAGVLLLASLALGVAYLQRAPAAASATRFLIYPPEQTVLEAGDLPFPVAVSPDGRRLVLVMTAEGRTRLWLRPLDSLAATPLDNTDDAQNPFWSPDGRFIAFFAGGKLKKIAAAGGVPTVICDAPPYGNSGTWNSEDVILFTQNISAEGIQRVSAAGGAVTQVTKLDPSRHEVYHFWPQFLPDGRHFLFLAGAARHEDSSLYVGSLDTGQAERLTQATSHAFYAPPGYLLYLREGTLVAQPFDAQTRRLAGDPATVAEHVGNFGGTGNAYFSVSANGEVLAYQVASNPSRLVWLNRAGAEVGAVGAPNNYEAPRLSPDGQKLAVDVVDPKDGTNDIWISDLARATFTRFTFDPGLENGPVWSPDGRRIAYGHDSNGPPNLHQRAFGDAEGESLIPSQDGPQRPLDWSPDGQFLIYRDYFPQTSLDLLVLPMTGERKPYVFARTPFVEVDARFSPDGHWVAYATNESGRYEVYVRRFQGGGERVQVSNAGGLAPRWRRDGRELFYLTPDSNQTVTAVPAQMGETFAPGTPTALFKVEIRGEPDFDVTPDGQRFLVNTTAGVPSTPLTVITGWAASLKH